MKPFNWYDYLKWKDLERNPNTPFTEASRKWSEEDNKRMLLIALDRYADELQKVKNE